MLPSSTAHQNMKSLAAILSALILSACATQTPTNAPPPRPEANSHQALVVIYRANTPGLDARDASFHVDDTPVASLRRNSHTWFLAPVGEHHLTQNWPVDVPLAQSLQGSVDWQAGQTYYYKLSTESELVDTRVTIRWRFASVPEEMAQAELKSTRYVPASGAARLQTSRPAP